MALTLGPTATTSAQASRLDVWAVAGMRMPPDDRRWPSGPAMRTSTRSLSILMGSFSVAVPSSAVTVTGSGTRTTLAVAGGNRRLCPRLRGFTRSGADAAPRAPILARSPIEEPLVDQEPPQRRNVLVEAPQDRVDLALRVAGTDVELLRQAVEDHELAGPLGRDLRQPPAPEVAPQDACVVLRHAVGGIRRRAFRRRHRRQPEGLAQEHVVAAFAADDQVAVHQAGEGGRGP